MITLSASTLAMLYLASTLGFLLGIWIYQHYRDRKKRIVTISQELHVCEYCHFPYLDTISKAVTKCPQCSCFNKKKQE